MRENVCYKNYEIQFTKSSNIQQAEIRYDIEMKTKCGIYANGVVM